MGFDDIVAKIQQLLPQAVGQTQPQAMQPWVAVLPEHLTQLCALLRDTPDLYFDYLACLSGVDYGDRMEVVYHLTSLPLEHSLVLKVALPREQPVLPSVAHIWRAADWHEREAYDLLGITFSGHPDLRRILLPEDWPGHPLRKNYTEPDEYHGIEVKY